MRMALILCVALMMCSCSQSKNHTSSGTEPETWIEVQAQSSKYMNASGPEIILLGRITISGGRAASEPVENTQWSAYIQIGNQPWLPVDDLSDCQKSFNLLCGKRVLQDLNQIEVLIKGKLTKDPSQDNWPLVMIGWMRELLPDDSDWEMPWQVNLPLLSLTKDKDAISHIVACQAASDADSQLGYSGVHHASQTFKVVESFYGDKTIDKNLVLHYSYLTGRGRDLKKDERIIWILTKSIASKDLIGYGAVPDTSNNRLKAIDLANKLKETYYENALDKK